MIDNSIPSLRDHQQLDILSVGDFFRQINWSGKPLPEADDLLAIDTPYETVGQFFGAFPWRGAMVSMPPDDWDVSQQGDEDIPVEDDTLTLEDLSALF